MPKTPPRIRFYKLKDGSRSKRPTAVFQRPHPTEPGKRLTESKTFGTETEAKLWLAKLDVQYAQNPDIAADSAKTTFAQLIELWKVARFAVLAPSSRGRYEQVIKNHLLPRFGALPVRKVTRGVVRGYLAELQASEQYAPATVRKIQTTLSSIMAEAVERELLPANPCHDLNHGGRLLKPERSKDLDVLAESEVAALADAIIALPAKAAWASKLSHAPYRVLILTAAYSGLRFGELAALRRRDVDFDAGEIHVRRALKAWTADGPVFDAPKNGKQRDVPILDEINDLLADHLSSGGQPDDLVFVNSEGNAIRRTAFYNKFFVPARDVALPQHPDFVFHDLRHCFCSWLLEAGVPLAQVSQWAGHSNAAITAERYIHAMKKDNADARSVLGRTKAAEPHLRLVKAS